VLNRARSSTSDHWLRPNINNSPGRLTVADERERTALARDQRDVARLEAFRIMLGGWIDVMLPLTDPLESPGRRWHPADLIDDLSAHHADVVAELARLKAAVVIEDSDT
jgi:outer membrane protein TolC